MYIYFDTFTNIHIFFHFFNFKNIILYFKSSLPYLVDDFFLLLTTCVKSRSSVVRSVFDHPDILTRCTMVGTAGLLQDHPDALSSVISFFELLLRSVMEPIQNGGGGGTQMNTTRKSQLMQLLQTKGGDLVENIVLGITGKISWRHVKDGDFNMGSLLTELVRAQKIIFVFKCQGF